MSISGAKGQKELERENAALKEKVEALKRDINWQVSVNRVTQGSRSNVALLPEAMRQKFRNVSFQIDMFVYNLDDCLQVPSNRARVAHGMRRPGSGKAFRTALTHNNELRELAIQPLATERQVWTAYIWRFLVQNIFSFHGVREFYAATEQNASYYIKNIDEIEELMEYENEAPADKFARAMWRKQAIDAVFPTDNDTGEPKEPGANLFPAEDHPWLASTREAKIEELAAQLLKNFAIFAKILPDGLDATRKIISHAVRLNEYMMHEAQVTYMLDLEDTTDSDDKFHNNLHKFTMTAVNTDSGSPVNVESTMKGMLQSDIRKHLYKICTIEPAFRSQSWSGSETLELQHGPVNTEVKSRVAVGWALNRNNPPEKESMFYIMAQSLGLVSSAKPSEETAQSS